MRDILDARKRGDFAFRDKDFKTAIECYSQVPYDYKKIVQLCHMWFVKVSNLILGSLMLQVFTQHQTFDLPKLKL